MIAGIYLAAGQSKRMGCNKLLLPLNGRLIGSIALETALSSELDHVFVVTRMNNDSALWIPSCLFSTPYREKWTEVKCSNSINGQAESLKCGLYAAEKANVKAIIVLLADQPFISKDMIDYLVNLYKLEKPQYIASSHNGVVAPPVLFSAEYFPYLYQLDGDVGARKLIQEDPSGLKVILKNKWNFVDIDTRNQYSKINQEIKKYP